MTLTNYSVLIEAALEDRYIDEQELTLLKEWKKDPENWQIEARLMKIEKSDLCLQNHQLE